MDSLRFLATHASPSVAYLFTMFSSLRQPARRCFRCWESWSLGGWEAGGLDSETPKLPGAKATATRLLTVANGQCHRAARNTPPAPSGHPPLGGGRRRRGLRRAGERDFGVSGFRVFGFSLRDSGGEAEPRARVSRNSELGGSAAARKLKRNAEKGGVAAGRKPEMPVWEGAACAAPLGPGFRVSGFRVFAQFRIFGFSGFASYSKTSSVSSTILKNCASPGFSTRKA